jgi:NitT/TauT family transport system substrate-binding protein
MLVQAPLLLALTMVLVTGCQTSVPPATTSTTTTTPTADGSRKPDDILLALNWHPEAEHGGFYAALVHGYFKDEGLNVTIRPGGPGVRVIADVASGAATFGVDNADKLLVWRAQEADAVAVMSPLQDSPRCIMVHKESGIQKLEDLATKRPFTLGINSDQPFAKYLQKRVDLADVQMVKYSAALNQFLGTKDFGVQAYSFSEPFLAKEQGADPHCLMVSDVGFNTYTSVLIASRETIDKNPDLVARMTRASIRGWQKYLSDPDETNKYIHEQNPEMGLKVLEFGAKALKPLCLPEGFAENRLGEMSPERWKTLAEQLVEIEAVKPGAINAETAYTTKFLPKQNEPDKSPAR